VDVIPVHAQERLLVVSGTYSNDLENLVNPRIPFSVLGGVKPSACSVTYMISRPGAQVYLTTIIQLIRGAGVAWSV
jgi:hypothetical protein